MGGRIVFIVFSIHYFVFLISFPIVQRPTYAGELRGWRYLMLWLFWVAAVVMQRRTTHR